MHNREFDSMCIGAQETLGQFGGQILRLDRHLARHVERDGVRAVLVDDRAQPPARLGDGVVDRCRARVRRRVTGRSSADVSRPSSAAIISAWVAPLVHNRPKLVGCSLSPETRAMTRLPASGRSWSDLDAAADTAVRARRPGHRHLPVSPQARAPRPTSSPVTRLARSASAGTRTR